MKLQNHPWTELSGKILALPNNWEPLQVATVMTRLVDLNGTLLYSWNAGHRPRVIEIQDWELTSLELADVVGFKVLNGDFMNFAYLGRFWEKAVLWLSPDLIRKEDIEKFSQRYELSFSTDFEVFIGLLKKKLQG